MQRPGILARSCPSLHYVSVLPYGLVVRIPGFHPGGPGSTPGMGNCHFTFIFTITLVQSTS